MQRGLCFLYRRLEDKRGRVAEKRQASAASPHSWKLAPPPLQPLYFPSKPTTRLFSNFYHLGILYSPPSPSRISTPQQLPFQNPYPTLPNSPPTPKWYSSPLSLFPSSKSLIFLPTQAQTPQQRKANERYARQEAAKRGKPESAVKHKQKWDPPISKVWIGKHTFLGKAKGRRVRGGWYADF